MILEFLRSASGLLVRGPETLRSPKNKAREDEDNANVDSDKEDESNDEAGPPRGRVIITLRNVPPYTECKGFPSHGRLR